MLSAKAENTAIYTLGDKYALRFREMAQSNLNREKNIERATAIVYSNSLDERNSLRSQVIESGFNAVCFQDEAICFDNFKAIRANFVIADTDSIAVVWRFIFALNSVDSRVPLYVVSDQLTDSEFMMDVLQVPIQTQFVNRRGNSLIKKLFHDAEHSIKDSKEYRTRNLPLFVGQSRAIKQIRKMMPNVAESRDFVLIVGEQGTGKELLARSIVDMSMEENCFIRIDCAKIEPDHLIGVQIEKALNQNDKKTPVTIFIDHLDQLSPGSQAEMLLVIEGLQKSGNGMGMAGSCPIRFIAASDQPIERLVYKGEFRKDLFYRMNVIPIALPALRDRKEDISLLMDYLIIEACVKAEKCINIASQSAREICYMHNWPGNMDELQSQMRRVAETGSESCLYANHRLSNSEFGTKSGLFSLSGMEELPKTFEIKEYLTTIKNMSLKGICNEFISQTERRLLEKALATTNWNRKKAATLLDISYKTMLNKMKTYHF